MRPARFNSAATEVGYEPCRMSIVGETFAFLLTGFAAAMIIIAFGDGKKLNKWSFYSPT